MAYAYHIGVDYHKAYSHLVVQDASGKTLRSGRVRNDHRSIAGFLLPFSGNAHAVMEATRNWTVMFDWLDEIVDEVVLAHPLKVKAIAEAKIKTDKIDATSWRICCELTWCLWRMRRAHGRARCAWHCASGCSTCACALW
jgi:transposase